MAGNGVTCLPVEDVVEARLARAFIAQADEKLQRVGDLPARVSIYVHEALVLCGYLVGVAIPFQEALVEILYFLDDWGLKLQAGFCAGFSYRLAKLCDNGLLGFIEDEHAVEPDDDDDDGGYDEAYGFLFHLFMINVKMSKCQKVWLLAFIF